jgi:hypothetical protein
LGVGKFDRRQRVERNWPSWEQQRSEQSFALMMFSIARSDPLHVIRLLQIGPNHCNYNYLIFISFEIFSSVVDLEWSWSDLSPLKAGLCTIYSLLNLSESSQLEVSNELNLSEVQDWSRSITYSKYRDSVCPGVAEPIHI